MRKLGLAAVAVVGMAAPGFAYIGPGAGAGAIAVVLGVIAAVLMAFLAILWYPLKRFYKKTKGTGAESRAPKGSSDE